MNGKINNPPIINDHDIRYISTHGMLLYRCMFIAVILAAFTSAETIAFENNWGKHPLFNIISERSTGVEIIFSMHELVIEKQVIDGVEMKSFAVPAVFIQDPGRPNLGGASRYLALPVGSRAMVTIIDSRSEVYHNIDVAPAPNIPRDDDVTPLLYKKDMSIYGKNEYWPTSPVAISSKADIRGVDVVLLSVLPFQYNPTTKDLIVYKDIIFRVDFIAGNGHFSDDRLRSRFWDPILEGNLINFDQLPKIDFYPPKRLNGRTGYEYIIIVPDDSVFVTWGDTIKNWRKLQGISCDVFTLSEVGGSDSAAIKNFLVNAYNTWDPAPVAFLLLSDAPNSGKTYGIPVPHKICDGFPIPGDNWYADMNNDNLPDMHCGRICAQDNAQLSTMIGKLKGYERFPAGSFYFYNNPLTAGIWQSERWFQLCNEVIRGFWLHGLNKLPLHQYVLYSGTPVQGSPWSARQGTSPVVHYWYNLGWLEDTLNPYDSLFWNNGTTIGIIDAINFGTFMIQYRGNGDEIEWVSPPFDISCMNNLTNDMYPFVASMTSLTGKFDYTNQCFVEKFLRIQYGAVGLDAATEVNYSYVNDTYTWGFYDGLWPQFDPGYPNFDLVGYPDLRPCMAMTHGKYYLQASWMPDSAGAGDYRIVNYYLWHHYGDCFATIYSEIPESLTVVHELTLPSGQAYFTVTSNDSSVIALTANGEIIGVAEGAGVPVDIPISPQMPGSIIKVTVTKANFYRYEKDVTVITGISEEEQKNIKCAIKIYPMILHDQPCYVDYSFSNTSNLQVLIYDVLGRSVYNIVWANLTGKGKVLVNMKNLQQGVYFMWICFGDHRKINKIIYVK